MRPRRPLGATIPGLVVLTLAGGFGLVLLGLSILAWPKVIIPVLEILMTLLSRRRMDLDIFAQNDELLAGFFGLCAVMWVAFGIRTILRKPDEDRRLDAALMAKDTTMARGAPTEPADQHQA